MATPPIPLPVHFWPELPPLPDGEPQILAVRTPDSEDRQAARRILRQAVAAWLSQHLGVDERELLPSQVPGRAPLLPAAAGNRHLSLSHAPGLSLAALAGLPVGIDVQTSPPTPWSGEIPRLANDYLGPAVARNLAELPEIQRLEACVLAWTIMEACGKCTEQGLAEWSPARARAFASCRTRSLLLPRGYLGSIAWRSC